MREEALIALGRGLVLERLRTRCNACCRMKGLKWHWKTLFSQHSDFPLSVSSHPFKKKKKEFSPFLLQGKNDEKFKSG
jgi:hypothetical protein